MPNRTSAQSDTPTPRLVQNFAAATQEDANRFRRGELANAEAFLDLIENHLSAANEASALALLVLHFERSDRLCTVLHEDYADESQTLIKQIILQTLREKDAFVFVSQIECWILLPQLSSEALALLAVNRLLNDLLTPKKFPGRTVFLNPSMGLACAKQPQHSAMSLLRAAESAQRNAQTGKLKFVLAESSESARTTPEDLSKALEQVLDANSLEILYQPKVNVASKTVVSFEALIRWPQEHPQFIATQVVIDIAEQSGLIELLTMRVFNKVLCEMADWRRAGLDTLVWVNLSAKLLNIDALPSMLKRAIDVWDIPAEKIGFELTESALIHDIEHTTNLLFGLKELGFHLSIDDFGTGYSSLAYLRRFPIDELKIDRLFIHSLMTSAQDQQIVQSIIDLAHNFKLQVVAEGVEEADTMGLLQKMGCDQIQGYFFAKPISGEFVHAVVKQIADDTNS
ncbi:MAG: GGDEF domain-containing phosphodiesterase [Burkholderiaceae bacterium]|nr:GGDEF domain-containing phosphodiesterase [Burkholderiaceae bacterium]